MINALATAFMVCFLIPCWPSWSLSSEKMRARRGSMTGLVVMVDEMRVVDVNCGCREV